MRILLLRGQKLIAGNLIMAGTGGSSGGSAHNRLRQQVMNTTSLLVDNLEQQRDTPGRGSSSSLNVLESNPRRSSSVSNSGTPNRYSNQLGTSSNQPGSSTRRGNQSGSSSTRPGDQSGSSSTHGSQATSQALLPTGQAPLVMQPNWSSIGSFHGTRRVQLDQRGRKVAIRKEGAQRKKDCQHGHTLSYA